MKKVAIYFFALFLIFSPSTVFALNYGEGNYGMGIYNVGATTVVTNDSLTFTNPFEGTGNDSVADNNTIWNMQAVVSVPGGYGNLNTVTLRLANSSDATTPYDSLKLTWTQSTNIFAETGDTQNAVEILSTGSDASCSTNTCTLSFKLKFSSNFTSQSSNYAAELLSIDDSAASDLDNYANFYQVIPAVATISISSPANISLGTIYGTGASTVTDATWTVTTDSLNGYKLEWQASSASIQNANLDTIDAYTPLSSEAPEIWSVLSSAAEWGGRLKSSSTDYSAASWGIDDVGSAKWLNVLNTAAFQIASRNTATLGSDQIVQLKAAIGSSKFQPTGNYSVSITLTATTL